MTDREEQFSIQIARQTAYLEEISRNIADIRASLSEQANVVRDNSSDIAYLKTDVDWLKRAFWTLVVAFLGTLGTAVISLLKK